MIWAGPDEFDKGLKLKLKKQFMLPNLYATVSTKSNLGCILLLIICSRNTVGLSDFFSENLGDIQTVVPDSFQINFVI